jgi:hypothetical protein
MSASRGNPYHDQHGRFTTGGSAAVTSDLAVAQRAATAAKAGTPESGVPGQAARPTPPTTPPVFATADGGTAIHLRDGKEPAFEVWRNGELVESVRATRAWRQEKQDLIARYDGSPPTSGVDKMNSAIRSASGRGAPAPAEGERDELHRLLSEEALFNDPTGDAAELSTRAAALAQTWAEYGQQYGGEIFAGELARARRAAASRARAQATKPTIRQELDLTNLIAENRLAENHAANRDAIYRQARADVGKVAAQGLGKYNELLAAESSVWNQREQAQYGDDIDREDYYYPFGDA